MNLVSWQKGYEHATRVLTFFFFLNIKHNFPLFEIPNQTKKKFLFRRRERIYTQYTPNTKAGCALNFVIAVNDRVEALQTVTDIVTSFYSIVYETFSYRHHCARAELFSHIHIEW